MTKRNVILMSLLLVMVSLVSYWGIIKPSQLSTETSGVVATKNNSLKIAVVNEDVGMVYNGQELNIGQLLTTSYSSKSSYPVEVVSRSIAEKGLETGIYQLMVVLPSRFSQDSLALEATSPNQAVFQYQIKSDKSHLVKQAEQAVVDLKGIFNKDLIHIYFLSIVGNLQAAQGQVSDVVTADNRALLSFETNLLHPLGQYSKQFSGISSSPTELLASYSNFQKGLIGTNESFSSIIDVNKVYTTEIDQVKTLQDQWQDSLLRREESLKAYDGDLSKLSIEEQLNQLLNLQELMTSEYDSSELYATTKATAGDVKAETLELVESLKALNTKIDETFTDYESKIEEAVESSLTANPDVDMTAQAETLGTYLQTIRQLLLEQFEVELGRFQGFNEETIDRMALSEADKAYLKTINGFAQDYARAHDLPPIALGNVSEQDERLLAAKTYVISSLEQEREVALSSVIGEVAGISVTVPVGYELVSTNLTQVSHAGQIYRFSVPDATASSVRVAYKLVPIDEDAVNLLTPLAVTLEVETKERLEYFVEESDEVSPPSSAITETSTSSTTEAEASSTSSTETETSTSSSTTETSSSSSSSTQTETNTNTGSESSSAPSVRYNRETKEVERTYKEKSVLLPYQDFLDDGGQSREGTAFDDFASYFELSGVIKTYFGHDLSELNWSSPAQGSLIQRMMAKEADTDELKAIIISLIQETTITEIKDSLKISEEQLTQIEELGAKSDELSTSLEQLETNLEQLSEKLATVVQEARTINETILEKPAILEEERQENTDLVTVSLSINSDLEKLKAASQTLMENTTSHQLVSESIQRQMDNLVNDVKTLEDEGAGLESRVTELYGIMSKEYSDNTEFLKSFSTVLSNTKVGNGQNSLVYEYLSNPVDASKIENLVGQVTRTANTRQDERSGFLLVLMSFLVSLGATYIIQHSDRTKWPRLVQAISRRHWTNSLYPFTLLTVVSVLVAVIMAGFAGYRLELSGHQKFLFALLLFVLNQLFAHGINSLNHYLKSYGFLMSLFLVLLYLISAGQLLDSYYVTHHSWLSAISPLTHLEEMLTAFLNNKDGWTLTFIIAFLLAGGMSGLTIYRYQELDE